MARAREHLGPGCRRVPGIPASRVHAGPNTLENPVGRRRFFSQHTGPRNAFAQQTGPRNAQRTSRRAEWAAVPHRQAVTCSRPYRQAVTCSRCLRAQPRLRAAVRAHARAVPTQATCIALPSAVGGPAIVATSTGTPATCDDNWETGKPIITASSMGINHRFYRRRHNRLTVECRIVGTHWPHRP